ncbi:MAG TPA: hypothetical protein VH350_02850 [Candidatus Sulfotelmatobacter sp.]|jgi:hypothetical protein|nr:hypothetical protein [Candidatus Sulfotelmatobacter sp.]
MKRSTRAVLTQRKRFALSPFVLCLVASSICWGIAAQAQDKPPEPSHIAGWVVIPVDEYRVLRAKAYPVEHDPEPPPLDATLSRVDYDLRVAGDLAAGRATLTVDVLKDGWVRVPVPTGLLVREARLDGKPISLVPASPGKNGAHLAALLAHAGRFELLLDVDVPIASAAGDQCISLPATESGVTRAVVVLPQQGIELKVGGGLLAEKSEAPGETKWLAYARGNEALTLTWRKKTQYHHVELPLRLRGSLTQLTSLAEDSTSIYAEANFEIVQGAARDVRIQLPEKVTINQVSGALVADWEIKNGELDVTFLEPVERSARFVINGEMRLPRDGIIDIPLLRLLDTERESGGVAVEILGAGEIKDQKTQGLEDADATDLGEMVASRQSPALVAFRARSGEAGATRSLSVNVARYDQQAVLMANVEEARYQVLMSADGKELVQARYAVRNNQRNFVKVTLPAGATVWSVSLAGRPIRPGQAPDGSLLLPLEKSRGGNDAPAFAVEILYLTKASAWSEKGREKLILPALDLPISRTGLLLYYPPLFRVSAEPGTFHTQEYQSPVSAALGPLPATIGGPVRVANGALPYDRRQQFAESPTGADQAKKDATQTLLDTFKAKSSAGKVIGILPINVSFPAFGPSIFLVSELTSENQSPAAEFNFQRDKKAGVR